jgi:drug/metabolite transporter (DMT)-like permease
MLWLVIATCVFAGAFNAGSTLLEREASRTPDISKLFSAELSKQVIQSRTFLLGLLLQICASIFEVVALSQGSLTVIGPLLTLDIVFLWIFLSYKFHLRVRWRSWGAVALVLLGISLFFISAQPKTGHNSSLKIDWLLIVAGVFALIAFAYSTTRGNSSPKYKASVLGAATAANFALNGALVKLLFLRIHNYGFHIIFTSWPLYTLLLFLAISILLTQNTFSAGPVTISQPIIEVFQAVASVMMGVFVFNGAIEDSAIAIVGISAGLVVTTIGVSILASNESQFVHKKV